MTNLLTVAPPGLDLASFTHILPSLERAGITAPDLLTLDPVHHVAKRAQVPPAEVRKLRDVLLASLHAAILPSPDDGGSGDASKAEDDGPSGGGLKRGGQALVDEWHTITTLDDRLDAVLGGGVAVGRVTEIVGESAAGKTQFLLTLLLSAQLPPPHGLSKSALYISTEAPLQTTRLTQILATHPRLVDLPATTPRPTLSAIQSTHIHSVEAQDHILRYQVPVALRTQNIGLLVIDSIAANYRAEFDRGGSTKSAASFARRSEQLNATGALLRHLAQTHHVAVVVANQVADRFAPESFPAPLPQPLSQLSAPTSRPASPALPRSTQHSHHAPPPPATQPSQPPHHETSPDPLALDHQHRFTTGWGATPTTAANPKTPSLGLAWTNQLAARIALLRDPVFDDARGYEAGEDRAVERWARRAEVVFSSWGVEGGVGMEIWEGGVRGVGGKGGGREGSGGEGLRSSRSEAVLTCAA